MSTGETQEALLGALHSLSGSAPLKIADAITTAMKFSECVPEAQLSSEASLRFGPGDSATVLASWPIRVHVVSTADSPAID
jgi:hypothetical protein